MRSSVAGELVKFAAFQGNQLQANSARPFSVQVSDNGRAQGEAARVITGQRKEIGKLNITTGNG
jgi:hypothetical protein